MIDKIKLLLKKKSTWFGIVVVVVVAYFIIGALTKKPVATRYVTAPVQLGTLTSSVTGTGQIAVLNEVDLKPQTSGTVTSVRVKVGQAVKAGDVIATVDETSEVNQINQAKASLESAQANYNKLVDGLTPDDQTLAQLSVTQAQQSLANAQTSYANTKTTQDLDVSKALTNLLNSGLEPVPSDSLSSATVTISGTYTGTAQGQFNVTTYNTDGGTYYSSGGLATMTGPLTRGIALPIGDGLYVTFGSSGSLSTTTSWTISLPNTASSDYLSDSQAYTTAQQNEAQALQSAQQQIDSAQDSLTSAQTTYDEKTAPPADSDVASAQAQVTEAQAQLSDAETAYQNNIITAPFDGIIAVLNAQVGDQAISDSSSTSTAFATLITAQNIAQISLNEVDAAKVKVGQKVVLTFPALTDYSTTGTVGEMDILGTVTQNVVTYNLKIYLDTQDPQVKPGMSVNASIITDVAENVLNVPSAAVKGTTGSNYVQVLVNGQPQQVPVTVGISSDTATEISGNIKQGDEVVTQTITGTTAAAATTTRSATSLLGGGGAGGFTAARAGGGGFAGGGAAAAR